MNDFNVALEQTGHTIASDTHCYHQLLSNLILLRDNLPISNGIKQYLDSSIGELSALSSDIVKKSLDDITKSLIQEFGKSKLLETWSKVTLDLSNYAPGGHKEYDTFENLELESLPLLKNPKKILYLSGYQSLWLPKQLGMKYGCDVNVVRDDSEGDDLLKSKISFVKQACLNFKEYDLIYIEEDVLNKWKMLHTIRKLGSNQTLIICCLPNHLGSLFFDEATINEFYPGARVESYVNPLSTKLIIPALSSLHDGIHYEWLDGIGDSRSRKIIPLMNSIMNYEPSIGYPGPISVEQSTALIQDLNGKLDSQTIDYLYMEVNGEFVGQVILSYRQSPNNRHIADVVRVFFSPYIRSQTTEMENQTLQYLLNRCKEKNIDVLCIDTKKGSSADRKWTQLGFKTYGILPDYSRVNGVSCEGLYMYMSVN